MSDSEQLRSETETGQWSVQFYWNRAEECRQKMLEASHKSRMSPSNLLLRDAYWTAHDDWQASLYDYEKAKDGVRK